MSDKAFNFKMCMLGSSGVGKTSIRRSFMGLTFIQDHRATIGGDFSIKQMSFNDETNVTFSIWEVDPSHNFRKFRRHYLRNSTAGLVVMDVLTYKSSIYEVFGMIQEIDQHSKTQFGKIPICIIINKADLVSDVSEIRTFLIENFLENDTMKNRDVRMIFTSCVTGENINEMFYLMKVSIFNHLRLD
jgi:small GTP-binding protein